MQKRIVIGITGIIGSGKSTLSQLLHEMLPSQLIDVDQIGHQLLETDTDIMNMVNSCFGTINRPELAAIVFNDNAKLQKLNEITHPVIYKNVAKKIVSTTTPFIIIDAALLFQIGLNKLCNTTIFIETTSEQIEDRLKLKGLNPQQITQRTLANKKVFDYKKECTFIVSNVENLAMLKTQAEKIILTIS